MFDLAYQFHGFLPNVKLTQLARLPGVNTTSGGSSVALWRTCERFFAAKDELKDVQVLGMFVALPGPIFSVQGPIDSVAQLKGVKMHAIPCVGAKVMDSAAFKTLS